MGIKGLTAWVNEHTGSVSNLCVLKSPRLLLDGLGLAHHLLTTCHRSRHGDYAAYDAAARHFFRALLDVAGASLVLYLDGPQAAAPMKSATHAKRRTERAEAWGLVNRVCAADSLLDEALASAAQIADADPKAVFALKALMNDGVKETLGDALVLEGERGNAFAKTVDYSQMSARLAALRQRAAKQ